jgi:hypothetical protein
LRLGRPLALSLIVVLVSGSALASGIGGTIEDTIGRGVGGPQISKAKLLRLGRIEAPPKGKGVIVHADFPAGRPYRTPNGPVTALTGEITPLETAHLLSAVPVRGKKTPNPKDECSDPTFVPVGKLWRDQDLPIEFAINLRTVPKYMSPWLATRSLREAHHSWSGTNSSCEDKDKIDFSFLYVGATDSRMGFDGVNTIDFGRLRRAVAISYLWYSGARIREVDMRLNNRYMWSNRPGVNRRYNVKNVAAHEIGHHLGLDDLGPGHARLTMFGLVTKGEMRKITLGRGDVRGAEVVTP